jgi:hypothetical protein
MIQLWQIGPTLCDRNNKSHVLAAGVNGFSLIAIVKQGVESLAF